MEIATLIRTHNQRLYLAESLKAKCVSLLGGSVSILNTGDRSINYSQLFVLALARALSSLTAPYILVLEDDTDFCPRARIALHTAVERGDSHNWYTIDTDSGVLERATYAPKFGYLLFGEHRVPFSGAVLVRRDLLQLFVEDYMLHFTEFEFPNVDICLSLFLSRRTGHLHLRPGYFFTKYGIESSITFSVQGRHAPAKQATRYTGADV